MTPADPTPIDDDLLAELLAADAALAAGGLLGGSSWGHPGDDDRDATVAGAPPDLRECLRMLEKAWPRSVPDGSQPPVPSPPWRLGRFEVLHELGRGGFGIVYLAHDPKLGRRVALKVPRPEALLSERLRRRFLREARAAGGLDHPNIVPVFETGEDGLLCYIASAYCDGPTLASWLRRRGEPAPIRLAARLVEPMAAAVQHAHDRGILHCDIKPSNVLLQHGPDLLDPDDLTPRLTDFGLAQLTEGAEAPGEISRSGVPIGSPPYMAPEQAAGRQRDLDHRTDVYALGATLYELLTGRPPFRGETMTETLRLVIETDPVPPRTLRPGLSRDLETVCLTCLAKDPARRYPSAAALAEDLGRFLADVPVVARPAPAWERGLKWTRRHPATATAIGLIGVLLLGLFGVAEWSNAWLRMHNEALRREAQRADQNARIAERFLHADRLRLAKQALDLNQRERTQEILDDIRPAPDGSDPRGFVWRYLWRASRREVVLLGDRARWGDHYVLSTDGRTLVSYDLKGRFLLWDLPDEHVAATIHTPEPILPNAGISPDGALLAVVGNPPPESGRPRVGWLWNARTGQVVGEVAAEPGRKLESLTPLANGRLLAVQSPAGADAGAGAGAGLSLRLLECAPGLTAPRLLAAVADDVALVHASPDGTLLVVVRNGRVGLHDAGTGASIRAFTAPRGSESWDHVAFSADGRTVLGLSGRLAVFWDVEREPPAASYDLGRTPTWHALAPDGSTLAVADETGPVSLWRRDRGRVAEFPPDDRGGEHQVRLAFSPDAATLAVSSDAPRGGAGPITLRGASDGHEIGSFPGRRELVQFLGFLPSGDTIVVGGGDWPRLWRCASIGEKTPEIGHRDEAWATAFSPDGRLLATGSDDTDDPLTLKLWEPTTGRFLRGWKPHPATVAAVAFQPNGRLLATAGLTTRENLRLWEVETGRLAAELFGHTDRVRTVAFSPDGRTLASAGSDGAVRLWDVASGRPRFVLKGHSDVVRKVVFSPDGRTLASAGNDDLIRLWDVESGQLLRGLRGTEKFSAVVYTIDGATIAAADEDGVITLWDPATGERRGLIRSDDAELRCLAVSPDGRNLAAAGAFRTIRIWDLLSGQELVALQGHRMAVNSLSFSPDGRILASASHDGAVILWRGDAPP